MATYLKTFQALSYERLQGLLSDLFGLRLSQGGLMNLLRRAQGCFAEGRDAALARLRQAPVVASDETGCGSRAPTAGTGCSAARRRWCITPPRAGLARW